MHIVWIKTSYVKGVLRMDIKPCPFCGRKAIFDEAQEVYGTCFEYDCDCGLARVSLQICDYMTLEERIADESINHQYGVKYIQRVREEAIKAWNHRTPIT